MSNVKQLNEDGSVSIPSNFPRTRRGPDSRGFRLLAQEIGRSCSLNQGYIIFMDGSAYVYTAPSQSEFEDLCASLQRGRRFNLSVRRAVFGFTRGFTPPADYEVIYEYPPYEGSAPGPCDICSGLVTNIEDTSYSFSIINGTGSGTNSGNVLTLAYDSVDLGGAFGTMESDSWCMREAYIITCDAVGSGVSGTVNAAVFVNGVAVMTRRAFGDGSVEHSSALVPAGPGSIGIPFDLADGIGNVVFTLTPATAP